MVTKPDSNVILLSIKPEFADAIMSGEKTVEFRRWKFTPHAEHVVIYSSQPVQKVVGYFQIAGIERASKTTLWEKYGECGAISRSDLFAYLDNVSSALAIRVGPCWMLRKGVSLRGIANCAPQSFAYLTPLAWQRVLQQPTTVVRPA